MHIIRYSISFIIPCLDSLSSLQVDLVHVMPPVMVQLASSNDVTRGYDLSCLRSVCCAGAPLSRELEEDVMRILGGHCQIRQGK